MTEDPERLERIGRFAAAYVAALGLTGDEAASVQAEVQAKLQARELLDDAALVTRVRRMQRDEHLRAQGLTQEEIDETREQLYGTTAYDTYRGQLSRTLERLIQGDDSARPAVDALLNDAASDDQVMPEQLDELKRLAGDTLSE
jgi:hypothetical protein